MKKVQLILLFLICQSVISCADNTQDAYRYATEAAELVLEDYIEDLFEGAPKPSEIKNIKLEENQCIALIKIDTETVVKGIVQ
ncbi:MAG: hypothetical protein ACLSEA_02815 [Thomasclavelia ramosa]